MTDDRNVPWTDVFKATERLLTRCSLQNECWMFTGGTDRDGYAVIRLSGRQMRGHRLTWMCLRGSIPIGLVYDHLCRNRACVNPYHGDLVPSRVNVRRSPDWLGNRTQCPQGHLYNEENTRWERCADTVSGWRRVCRRCRQERSANSVRLIAAAALSQGLSRRDYIAKYGRGQSAARAILGARA